MTVAKATARTNGEGADVSDAARFGLVTLQAFKQGTETLWYSNYIHGHQFNNFVESGATNKWYDGSGNSRTHMYRIEEAEYPCNQPNMITVDGANYASIFLPYAMTLPENVDAYAAATADVDGEKVLKLTKVNKDSQDIPTGGYILYSETVSGKITIMPAAANPTCEDVNELTGSTIGSIVGDGNIYVLGKTNGIGFYRLKTGNALSLGKAYYIKPADVAPVTSFRFSFDEIETAIRAIATEANNADIYDLNGRRVKKAEKGIYIVNGKKVMFK